MNTINLYVGAASTAPRPPRNPYLLTWFLIASLVGLITSVDLIAFEGQLIGFAATISQTLLVANERTHGAIFLVVCLLLGILAGHLFIPRARGERLNRKQLGACLLIALLSFVGSAIGTLWLYQAR